MLTTTLAIFNLSIFHLSRQLFRVKKSDKIYQSTIWSHFFLFSYFVLNLLKEFVCWDLQGNLAMWDRIFHVECLQIRSKHWILSKLQLKHHHHQSFCKIYIALKFYRLLTSYTNKCNYLAKFSEMFVNSNNILAGRCIYMCDRWNVQNKIQTLRQSKK